MLAEMDTKHRPSGMETTRDVRVFSAVPESQAPMIVTRARRTREHTLPGGSGDILVRFAGSITICPDCLSSRTTIGIVFGHATDCAGTAAIHRGASFAFIGAMTRWLLLATGSAVALAACLRMDDTTVSPRRGFGGDAGHANGSTPTTILPPIIPNDVGSVLNAPAAAHDELCTADAAHQRFPDDADTVTKTFCQDKKPGGVMPTPHGLADLLQQLGLDFKDPKGGNGVGGNPGFAILGHSSALTARKVTPITPTAFIFTPPPADGSPITTPYSIVGFDPGEQFVEVASYDPTGKNVNFYVVFFDQACNATPGGCTSADLLTPKLVTGWSNVRVYEDTTLLGNTILDCHVCHQPNNDKAPFLRMQEIAPPFTHWFSADTEGGRALLADFHAAHEDYGGIPALLIDKVGSEQARGARHAGGVRSAAKPVPVRGDRGRAEVVGAGATAHQRPYRKERDVAEALRRRGGRHVHRGAVPRRQSD